jgi:hypothetical protein
MSEDFGKTSGKKRYIKELHDDKRIEKIKAQL